MKLISEHSYHKNYRKYCKNSRWKKFVFDNNYNNSGKSSFEFIIYCLINNLPIPLRFYPHYLKGISKAQKKQLAKKLGLSYKRIKIVELHFDGRSSDMLLEYSKYMDIIDIINIGTHKELF